MEAPVVSHVLRRVASDDILSVRSYRPDVIKKAG